MDIFSFDKHAKKQRKLARKKYDEDVAYCKKHANNNMRCNKFASNNKMRRQPGIKDLIYPWKNYDWDYATYVDNNYNVKATGATKEGTIDGLWDNMKAMGKVVGGYIDDPNPAGNSAPGGYGKSSDTPYNLESCPDNKCMNAYNVRRKFNQKKPYNNKYFNNKLNGEKSSSYYFKVGNCDTAIKNKNRCIEKGYSWIGGNCYQPRYAYVDNSPGLVMFGDKLKGSVPSLINNAMAFRPDKIVDILRGRSLGDEFNIQQCPAKLETFSNKANTRILIIIALLLTISLFYIRK
jgi:hypothetical protein